MERKLTAILCADVYGYSRLMGEDEKATLYALTSYRKIIDSLIEQHRGRFVNSAGDSVLAEFASVVNAVECAVEIQTALKSENASLSPERRMEFRIGVNLGDVMVEGEQIYGDGVNVAARLESLAEPGGICISNTVHDQVSTKLALSYADLGEQQVKNIAKPVRVFRVLLDGAVARRTTLQIPRRYWRGGVLSLAGLAIMVGTIVLVQHLSLKPPHTHASIPQVEKSAPPLPSLPSIAVLPFTNLNGDPQQDYFSDGITDDVVTDLSRLPGLFVIDRNSTFAYKGKTPKVQEVGRELGVKYVLEGSVRKAADRVRIAVQLVDASSGNQVWGQRYDRQFRDIFKLQDEIVQSLVATLNVQLPVLKEGYVVPQRTKNLEAYDYYLRGIRYDVTPEGFVKAQKMFEKAIELDPGYADAYAQTAFLYFVNYVFQWDRAQGALDHAAELIEKSIVLDDSDAYAYALRGWIELFRNHADKAIADVRRALSLDLNNAFGCRALSSILSATGRLEEALAYVQKARRLDPLHPELYWPDEGNVYNKMGRYVEALDALKRGDQNIPTVHLDLVYTYSELGREADARAEAAELMRLSPQFTVEAWKQRIAFVDWNAPRLQRAVAAWHKAGLK